MCLVINIWLGNIARSRKITRSLKIFFKQAFILLSSEVQGILSLSSIGHKKVVKNSVERFRKVK